MKPSIPQREQDAAKRSAWKWPRPCPTCGRGVHPRDWDAHVNHHRAEAGGQLPLFGDAGVRSP